MALRNPDGKGKDPRSIEGAIFGGIIGVAMVTVIFVYVLAVPFWIVYWIVVGIRWAIGVDDGGKATCKGCGQEVDRKLTTCANCGTPARNSLGTTPKELTPSDLVLLEMTPKRNEELPGVDQVQVDDPPSAGIERLLATALLANEEAGAFRLEMVKEKVVAVAVGNSPW